ncbi:methyltransferase-like protein 27 [Ylistrum balloti]|uniref:methyltransferase-like protein 27 n=1 Tax=Ylistrum balloti TaxID=509963 RepID=UPI002905F495|nr:methyltransferase-like protein 27 [Ylistrum balloti]
MAADKEKNSIPNLDPGVHVSEINNGAHRPGISMAEVADYYSKWAEQYDSDIKMRYLGPSYAYKALAEEFPLSTTDRKNISILDVACGTGLLGEKLYEEGFTNLDGLDPSEKMLDVARAKNIYNTLYCEFMSDAKLPIDNDRYSCVMVSGGMGEGHIPCAAAAEMIRIVKPGGFVIIAMREAYLSNVKDYDGKLDNHFLKLQDEGRWKMCSRTVVPKYSFDNNGVIYKFQVCSK